MPLDKFTLWIEFIECPWHNQHVEKKSANALSKINAVGRVHATHSNSELNEFWNYFPAWIGHWAPSQDGVCKTNEMVSTDVRVAHTQVDIYTCIHILIHTYANRHIHTYSYMHIYIHTYTQTCLIYTHPPCIYTHTYAHVYTNIHTVWALVGNSLDTFGTRFGHVFDMFHTIVGHVSDTFPRCFGNVSDTVRTRSGHVSVTFGLVFGHLSDMFFRAFHWVCLTRVVASALWSFYPLTGHWL
jgi:hypothetical protein